MPTGNPTALSFYGVAKEATKNTYVAPTDFVPLTKFDPVDKTHWMNDDGMRGSMVKDYQKIAGPVWSEVSCSGPIFPDTVGYPLMSLLGDVTTTGGGAPFTHAGSLRNSSDGQPVSDSWTDFDSVETRGYTGMQVYSMDVKWDGEKLLTWDGTMKGYRSATQSKPTASYTAITALPGWLSLFAINSISSTTLISADIKLKREGGPIHTADGTQAPYQMFVGELEVSGKLVLVADVNTHFTDYLAGTQIPLDFNFAQGAGAAAVQFKLHSSLCNVDEVKVVRGKRWVEYDLDFTALPNATDAGASGGLSPIKATLQNAKPAATYV